MAVTRQTLAELTRQAHVIEHMLDGQTRDLSRRWVKAWDAINDAVEAAVTQMMLEGEDAGVSRVVAQQKAAQALRIASAALTGLLQQSAVLSRQGARRLIQQATVDQVRLVGTQLPRAFNMSLVHTDARQMAAIGRRSLQQITVRHYYLNARATEAMKHHLTVGVSLGHNPRDVVAQDMVDAVKGEFEGGLERAQVIARTEQLDAYRAAAKASDQSMSEVLDHWVWHAELGGRTCVSCLAMHGTEHPLDEDGPIDHHQGLCTRLPVTKTWAQLGFKGITEPDPQLTPKPGDGVDWLRSQSAETQQKIMGPKRYHAWHDGDYPPADWSVRKTHWSTGPDGKPRQDWRDSMHVGPVRER